MKKEISRTPSLSPSPKLREHLNKHREGVTERINNIYDRYDYMIRSCALELEPAEKRVLFNILSSSFVEPSFIEHLSHEIIDSADYEDRNPAALSLYEKCKSASYVQLLATVERAGY
ncbi:hypothetical protein P9911_003825 [Klebsiella oxytoca]|uniref:hypothetical protein n=1 Tax=Klebsiella oxytoca TaxID=571 RepID=UPI00254B9CA0|nr:hypothetical protein [Klebsiella oxytoca]MEC5504978.1 hypothetical protein [Klebsiella oxytoca]